MLGSVCRYLTLICAAVALFACGGVPQPGSTSQSSSNSNTLFSAPVAVFSPDLHAFQRWQSVKSRFASESAEPSQCSGTDRQRCPSGWWSNLITKVQNLPLPERVAEVNTAFNQIPYVPAKTNWNDPGYWETPYEFLARGGQCQDYAIAKYLALVATGVSESQLRFVVVRDNEQNYNHAITIASVDGESLVLDNQSKTAEPVDQVNRYTPYYALNNSGWWAYQLRPTSQIASR
jgi:predicted transglutaminase-like cysteine proteinase